MKVMPDKMAVPGDFFTVLALYIIRKGHSNHE